MEEAMRANFSVMCAVVLVSGCFGKVCDQEQTGEAATHDQVSGETCPDTEHTGEAALTAGTPCTVGDVKGRADADGVCCVGCIDGEGVCHDGFPACGKGGQSCCDDGNTCTLDQCGKDGQCFNWSRTTLDQCGNGGRCLPEKGPDEPPMCCMGCITFIGKDLVCVDACPNGDSCSPGGRCPL